MTEARDERDARHERDLRDARDHRDERDDRDARVDTTTSVDAAAAGTSDVQKDEEDSQRSGRSGVAATIAGVAAPVISAVDSFATGARRMIGERGGARVRRVRQMGRESLANLWELHPEAHRASIRELGFQGIPVERIAGTAVEGSPQRGGDFLPLRDRRGDDWRARWQRILQAIDELVTLPPVELIKFGNEYWVVDGHNRVGAALYTGQDEIDAIVQELRLPGMPAEPPTLIAGVLDGSMDLRDAGAGRYTRTTTRPVDRLPTRTTETYSDGDRSDGDGSDADESGGGR